MQGELQYSLFLSLMPDSDLGTIKGLNSRDDSCEFAKQYVRCYISAEHWNS